MLIRLLGLAALLCISSKSSAENYLAGASNGGLSHEFSSSSSMAPTSQLRVANASDYSQWWLAKGETEKTSWLALWNESVEPIAKGIMNSDLRFTEFMHQVMNANIELDDFNPKSIEMRLMGRGRPLRPYILNIAYARCENYRKGMSYDGGRERADQDISAADKEDLLAALKLGSSSEELSLLGLYLHSLRIDVAVNMLCGELAQGLKPGSAFN